MYSCFFKCIHVYFFKKKKKDSAAGATAYACGKKTYNAGISVDASGQPIGTLLEAAIAKGYKTGIVAKSRISHATPAAFSSHVWI